MPNIQAKKTFKSLLLIVDVLLILLAYLVAFVLRYDDIPQRNWDSFQSLMPWIALLGLFFLSINELYSINRKTIWDMMRSLFVSMTLLAFLTMSISFLFREFALPRSVILIAYFLTLIFLSTWKAFFVFLGHRNETVKTLLVAEEEEAGKLISQIKIAALRTKISHIHPNTEINRIFQLIESHDNIMLSSNMDQELKSLILYHAMKRNKTIYVVPSLYDLLLTKSTITSVHDSMVMAVRPFGLTIDERIIKRALDIVLSVIGLIVLSPAMLFTMILIKIDSPKGSVFYKQTRIGQNNKEFTIIKFRSMVQDAEGSTGPTLATHNDPRITKIGRYLRRWRLDELPQIVNVLKGEMSIVGPRPEREFFTKSLNQQYDSYQYRNTVKPGITGYAQIMGNYTTNVQDKLVFDLYYIRNYSLWMDIVIMIRTLSVVMDRTKAEGHSPKSDHSNAKSAIRIDS
ncbi:polyprenyl glycosylphosphotransferase [Cohnella sp. CIP 111063]|uniref:sugar transferase n=1 Tax=unclassified Cohnella TaxID=2636738 RepID=UPI000B8C13D6|nr:MULTISPECIES: sugar transferase [unclassified Cohnella]OXS55918.1 polyprenyl glycosylphosphotransferase [Cohnella sp. CIP 111063]PRX67122.1 exopolysaccharide biosynthesis polyprenyl glycosylphosphotransferase [Cohnella sp. SGD-V74]